MPLVFFAPLAASGSLLDRRSEHTKGSALVNPLLPPRAQVRGAVKLPHTPERRLGGTAHRQAEYACGGPTDAEPTPKGAGPPPFNLTALRLRHVFQVLAYELGGLCVGIDPDFRSFWTRS